MIVQILAPTQTSCHDCNLSKVYTFCSNFPMLLLKKKNPFLWSHPIIEAFFVVKNENLSMLNASNFLSIGQGKCYVAHSKYSVTPDNFSSYRFVFYALMAQCSFCLANALIPSIQTGWEMTDLSFRLSCKVRHLNGSKNILWILREDVSINRTDLKYCGKSPKICFHSYFHIL